MLQSRPEQGLLIRQRGASCRDKKHWFALFPDASDTADTEHYFNGGFTYLVSDDIQWDIRAGKGLNSSADDYFIGTGVSLRYR